MANSITLGHLDFPTTVDVSNGPVSVSFSVDAMPAGTDAGIEEVMFELGDGAFFVSFKDSGTLVDSFDDATPGHATAVLTLAIPKDLGYTIRDTIVSADGHTFVAGDGTPVGRCAAHRRRVHGRRATIQARSRPTSATPNRHLKFSSFGTGSPPESSRKQATSKSWKPGAGFSMSATRSTT